MCLAANCKHGISKLLEHFLNEICVVARGLLFYTWIV
jgi:hypothetical protein